MDDLRSGNPRTLGMHQEMAIRNIQRASAQETRSAVVRESLNVSMVIAVNAQSDVQLEAFYEADTGGPWFSCLNHVTPRVGDMVVYTYLKGAPIALGSLPNEFTSWRGPRTGMPDTFVFEDFDIGAVSAGGDIGGAVRLTHVIGTSAAVTMSSRAGHPGLIQVGAANIAGSYAYVHTWAALFLLEDFTEFEFMVQTGVAGMGINDAHFALGWTTDGVNLTNSMLALYHTSGAFNWNLSRYVGGVVTNVDTGVPVVLAHWYILNFKRLGVGWWRLTAIDVTDPLNPIRGEAENTGFDTTNLGVASYMRSYALASTTLAKWLYLDYYWHSRRGLVRGR